MTLTLHHDQEPPPPPPPGHDPDRRSGKRPMAAMPGGRQFRTFTLWLLLALLVVVLVQYFAGSRSQEIEISYTDFRHQIDDGNIKNITIVQRDVKGEVKAEVPAAPDGSHPAFKHFKVYLPAEDSKLPTDILAKSPDTQIRSKPSSTPWFNILFSWWVPALGLLLIWIFFLRQMQSGGSAAFKFGKSKARILNENQVRVTFRDVAGADEAKEELQEIIEFLRDPKKFQTLGGRIPKGALLLGPPGTGKTLLAKAIAGEAGVPFFSMSGSDFVEMFVGVGASRVRDLFDQGKKNAPCIIFIDEIDAVGRHRGAGLGGGHDEREQTLNQLLVEMDGFESNEGVILIAATNRPDVLDPALLRPGRFDRQIVVDRPDVRGREGILKVHCRNKPLGDDVNLETLARGTPGLAGADLANLVNEAALLAARKGRKRIGMRDFEEAKDKVMMGTERKSLILSEEEKRTTAYHESGHALVGWMMPEADPIHKVTVIPRGRALGVTHFLPESDHYTRTKEYFLASMATMMGGRAAEALVFGKITNGAASDIQAVTTLARKMVCEWGMSDKLGPLQFGKREELIFLGREISQQKDYSEKTAESIDEEVHSLVAGAYERALAVLRSNLDKLHLMAQNLLEREILDRNDIARLLGEEPTEEGPATPIETVPPTLVEDETSGLRHPVPTPSPGPAPA